MTVLKDNLISAAMRNIIRLRGSGPCPSFHGAPVIERGGPGVWSVLGRVAGTRYRVTLKETPRGAVRVVRTEIESWNVATAVPFQA